MSYIYYYHFHPSKDKKQDISLSSNSPIPYDYDGSGFFSDRIYHSRNSHARFYIVTFGYEKSWFAAPRNRTINRYTLHFCFDGEGEINGTTIHRGDAYIVKPNEPYTVNYGQKTPITLGWIALSGTALEEMIEVLHLPLEPHFCVGPEQIKRIEEIFLDTVYENHEQEGLPFFLFSRFFQVLACTRLSYSLIPTTNNSYLDHAMGFINMHYHEEITVADIARELHISVSRLRSLFDTELGYSPQEAIINKRMSVAKAMLSGEHTMSIQSIANACGYSDQGAFSKRVKKETGLSPSEYRKKQREL